MERKAIAHARVIKWVEKFAEALKNRIIEKGDGTFSSKHEILGVITEEYYELVMAVHNESPQRITEELIDIAVGAIFAAACIDEQALDW